MNKVLIYLGTSNLKEKVIEDNYITSLTLGISGLQDVETQQVVIDVTIECTLDQINSLDTVTYPADLENY